MSVKNILVIGATGGSGRQTVYALRHRGHQVTALSRKASAQFRPPVRTIDGSALHQATLRKAIQGQDAVIITLGISENPFRVRLLGPKNTPLNIRSTGTQAVIRVMQELGVKRLIVQTTFGSGPSKQLLRTVDRLFFDWVLKPQIADTDQQDQLVRNSGLDWTIVQPVHLSDRTDDDHELLASTQLNVGQWNISRQLVGTFHAQALDNDTTIGQTVALSAV
ncbi:NAD(P)-dependent oxidoreductase [Marinicella sediminis]|uniref:NAD(P)-dependent oxidoreductase n=1 Tax=Marinicella sediminis TaxID=1792834 RepID=A0ABV7JF36_9GAMM|nr:NAD(P)-binding oxidoreductase [Marinicella sediminis]